MSASFSTMVGAVVGVFIHEGERPEDLAATLEHVAANLRNPHVRRVVMRMSDDSLALFRGAKAEIERGPLLRVVAPPEPNELELPPEEP